MKRLRHPRLCLLAFWLALLQAVVPLAAYAHMASTGTLLLDICSASQAAQTGGTDPAHPLDGSQNGVYEHAGHCALCAAAPCLPPLLGSTVLAQPAPAGLVRMGMHWAPPSAILPVPHSTGPPPRA